MPSARVYFSSGLSNVASLAIGLATGAIVARLLGPVDRGELASLMFIAATATGALNTIVSPQSLIWHVRSSITNGELAGVGDAVAVLRFMVLGTVVAVPLLLLTFEHGTRLSFGMAVGLSVATAVVQVLNNGLCAVQRARGSFSLVTGTVAVLPMLYLFGLLGLWATGTLGVATALGVNALSIGLCVAALASRLGKPGASTRAGMERIVRHGIRFFPVAGAGWLLASADRALLLTFGDLRAMGLFAAAQGLTTPLLIAAGTVMEISFVEVSGTPDADVARSLALARFRAGQIAITVLGAGLMIVGPWFMVAAFGTKFAPAVPALRWLTVGTVLRAQTLLLDYGLRSLGHSRLSLVSSLVGLGGIGVAGPLLIPGGGATGAAQAVAAGYAALMLALVWSWHFRAGAEWRELWGFSSTTWQTLLRLVARTLSKRFAWRP